MIKGTTFIKRMMCDKNVAIQIAEFCNVHNITKDGIITIEYVEQMMELAANRQY